MEGVRVPRSTPNAKPSRRSRRAFRDAEDLYHRLFAGMEYGVAVQKLVPDPAGAPSDFITIEANQEYGKILGVKLADVIGRRASEVLPAEEHRLWLDVFHRASREDHEPHFELFLPARGRCLHGHAHAIEGNLVAIVFKDATGRRDEAERLEKNRAELESIYESAPILMCTLDAWRRVLRANRAFTALTGVAEDALRGGTACGVFGCINAGDDPRGCGFGPSCQGCQLRLALEDTARTGRPHLEVEYRATLKTDHGRRDLVFLGSTVSIPAGREPEILLCLQDVTARVRAEEALRESDQRFQMAMDASNDGIWEWPDLGVPRYWWSPRFCSLIGYGADELDPTLDTFMDLMHPDDRTRVRDELSLRHRSTEPFETVYRLRTKSGVYRWFVARGLVSRGREGSPDRMIGTIRDITDRQSAQEALRQSEHVHKTVVESSPDIIARFDRSLRHLFVNPSAAAATGIPIARFIGRTNRELGMSEENVALWDRKLGEAFGTGLLQAIEFESAGPGGTRVYSSILVPEKAADGSVVSVLSIARDVTAERRARQALADEERRHRLLLDTLQEGILAFDAGGAVTYANASAARILGYDRDALRGKPLTALAVPDAGETSTGMLSRWFTAPAGRRECTLVRADGSRLDAEIGMGRLVGTPGNPSEIILSVLDITDRRRAVKELHESQGKLRSLARHLLSAREEERRKVAQEIHDELGQTLTGLSMDLRWLARRLGQSPSPVQEKLRAVIDLSDQTIRMVQRISSSLRPRMLDDLGLGPALEWLTGGFSRRLGIPCSVAVNAGGSRIGGNAATTLFRIVQEALTNVARHARASRVSIDLREVGDSLALQIHDDGIGISEADAASPRSFGLIGLRERVQELDGDIAIHGEPGAGTTISISIPFPEGRSLA
jgi:PAS domain S-box-containing protein